MKINHLLIISLFLLSACSQMTEEQKIVRAIFEEYNDQIHNYTYVQTDSVVGQIKVGEKVFYDETETIEICNIDRTNEKYNCEKNKISTNSSSHTQIWSYRNREYYKRGNYVGVNKFDENFDILESLNERIKKGKFTILGEETIDNQEYLLLNVPPGESTSRKIIEGLFKVDLDITTIVIIDKNSGEFYRAESVGGFNSDEFIVNDFVQELKNRESYYRNLAKYSIMLSGNSPAEKEKATNFSSTILNVTYEKLYLYENVTNSFMSGSGTLLITQINNVAVEEVPETII